MPAPPWPRIRLPARILFCEWVTSGLAREGQKSPLFPEGRALVSAIAKDLSRIANLAVDVIVAAELELESALPPGAALSVPGESAMEALIGRASSYDGVLLIAPETKGIHALLARRVEHAGGRLLGSTPLGIARAADKLLLDERLRKHGVQGTAGAPPGCSTPAVLTGVLKPRRGAGAEGVRRVGASGALEAKAGEIWTPWLSGIAASVTVLAGRRGTRVLLPTRQLIVETDDGQLHYRGTEAPLEAHLARRAARIALAAVRALSGLRGVVGVDVMLGREIRRGRKGADCVVEVNPRFTTSWLALRELARENLARCWLDCFTRKRARSPRFHHRPIRALPDGRIEVVSRTSRAALDIGGANIKAAHSCGQAMSRSFALWKAPGRLHRELRETIALLPPFDELAVTMTGELCDCYESRADGVIAILDALESAIASLRRSATIRVWTFDGVFVSPSDARARPERAGAANWLALAEWAAEIAGSREGLLIDIGSTTTDICVLRAGRAHPFGRTDAERLSTGELVYTGVQRTPLCAVASRIRFRGASTRVAAELFATTADLQIILGELYQDAFSGRGGWSKAEEGPRDPEHARARVARMVCEDARSVDWDEARSLAREFAGAQLQDLLAAARGVLERAESRPEVAVVSGSGDFLARRVAQGLGIDRIFSLRYEYDVDVSSAACAWALAHRHSQITPPAANLATKSGPRENL